MGIPQREPVISDKTFARYPDADVDVAFLRDIGQVSERALRKYVDFVLIKDAGVVERVGNNPLRIRAALGFSLSRPKHPPLEPRFPVRLIHGSSARAGELRQQQRFDVLNESANARFLRRPAVVERLRSGGRSELRLLREHFLAG